MKWQMKMAGKKPRLPAVVMPFPQPLMETIPLRDRRAAAGAAWSGATRRFAIAQLAGVACLAFGAEPVFAQPSAAPAKPAQPAPDLTELTNSAWSRWDRNQDNELDRREIVSALRSPKTKGYEASLLAILYMDKFADEPQDKPYSISKVDLLTLVGKAAFITKVRGGNDRLSTTQRVLFAQGDPTLDGFHQGRDGDCYLVANIALLVRNRPNDLRSMFSVLVNGDFRLTLPDGQSATVSPPTDGEILLGGATGPGHGIWLPVFQKAYAIILSKTGKRPRRWNFDETMFSAYIEGGLSVPTMQQLTGHKAIADAVIFGKESREQASKSEQVHTMLAKFTKDKTGVLLHTRRPVDKGSTFVAPPGWPDAHTLALFSYDADKRVAHIFNPWGNSFEPKGDPSLATGYVTTNGRFDMPLSEFMALFKSFSYETRQPFTA